ncbi:hypothetical protein VTL71DRAFT_12752 [Oculimacula yallundae]|uniref:DASH complex subunit DAD2 n=1 Tax=Oculimacula yallundae TaxID=86028 RepID=A0ABR4CP42_9HELO
MCLGPDAVELSQRALTRVPCIDGGDNSGPPGCSRGLVLFRVKVKQRISTTIKSTIYEAEAEALKYRVFKSANNQRTTYPSRVGQVPELRKMSYSSRPLPSHLRQASTSGNSASTGQSPILLARINEKKAELENLKQLRDLSAGLAGQMQMLEEKLSTLSDGTEAVAMVLGNWHNVLRAISMASMKIPKPKESEDNETEDSKKNSDAENPLPQTLVRIPTEHAPMLQQTTGGNGE